MKTINVKTIISSYPLKQGMKNFSHLIGIFEKTGA
jgi:hypothetical protein